MLNVQVKTPKNYPKGGSGWPTVGAPLQYQSCTWPCASHVRWSDLRLCWLHHRRLRYCRRLAVLRRGRALVVPPPDLQPGPFGCPVHLAGTPCCLVCVCWSTDLTDGSAAVDRRYKRRKNAEAGVKPAQHQDLNNHSCVGQPSIATYSPCARSRNAWFRVDLTPGGGTSQVRAPRVRLASEEAPAA
jgi:hypothetical protein